MSRSKALERYNELPVPGTTEEHWRFTDLRGFDTEAVSGETAAAGAPASMLALDVAAEAVVTETGIEITRAPADIRFEPLDESHERLGSLSMRAGPAHAELVQPGATRENQGDADRQGPARDPRVPGRASRAGA